MSAPANGRASWCCSTSWPTAPPTAATASPSRVSPGCRWPPSRDDLPLFAAAQAAQEQTCDAIRAEVERIDVDALTPREALDTLYRLKSLAREG